MHTPCAGAWLDIPSWGQGTRIAPLYIQSELCRRQGCGGTLCFLLGWPLRPDDLCDSRECATSSSGGFNLFTLPAVNCLSSAESRSSVSREQKASRRRLLPQGTMKKSPPLLLRTGTSSPWVEYTLASAQVNPCIRCMVKPWP